VPEVIGSARFTRSLFPEAIEEKGPEQIKPHSARIDLVTYFAPSLLRYVPFFPISYGSKPFTNTASPLPFNVKADVPNVASDCRVNCCDKESCVVGSKR